MAAGPRRWAELRTPELEALCLADPVPVGLLPVGATEQHGPHLPTGTDTILAEALSDAVSIRTGAVVLPSLPVGCSYFHGTELAGTLALSPQHLIAAVQSLIIWASHSGLRRFLLINGHVGNVGALRVAVDGLRYEHQDLRVGLVSWWSVDPLVAAETTSDVDDWHGNRAETSLMLAVAPDLVDGVAAKGADDEDRTQGLVFAYTAQQVSRNGITGRPSEATTELGIRLWTRIVDATVGLVQLAATEEPPFRR